MGVMSKPREPQQTPLEQKAELEAREMTVIQVPRAWVHDHGWPNWEEAQAERLAGTPGFEHVTRRQGEIVMDSYRNLDVAFLRKGPKGEAFLFVQAWRGAA
jgi:hypothetical protein